MCEKITYTLIGGLIGFLAAICIACLKRRRDAWDDFLTVIAELRSDLFHATADNKIGEFYDNSKRNLNCSIHIVRRHLLGNRRKQIDLAWANYRQKNGETFWGDEQKQRMSQAFIEGTDRPNGPKEEVDEMLRKFEDCIPKI